MEIQYVIINFLLLVGILFLVARKMIVKIFRGRRERINAQLDEAELIENSAEPAFEEPVFEMQPFEESEVLLREKAEAEAKIAQIQSFGHRECNELHRVMIEKVRKQFAQVLKEEVKKLFAQEPYLTRLREKEAQRVDEILSMIKLTPGDSFKIEVAPKGGGSENMSSVKMMIPADGKEGIKKFILDSVRDAGGKPCPPIIVGVGIGGSFEKCALIAKESLLREIDDESDDPIARELERELLEEINDLGIGAMGFGGRKTCLAVKVNVHPCHIASMPVAINIQCHAARHKSAMI